MTHPAFISDINFEGSEQKFHIKIRQGEKTYEFFTNYTENYPIKLRTWTQEQIEQEKNRIETLLRQYTQEFKLQIMERNVLRLDMNKQLFQRISKQLPKKEKRIIQKKYTKKAAWDIGWHRKITMEPHLLEILEEKNNIEEEIIKLKETK